MIYIGTEQGIYRWVNKTFWPAFHCLQERSVVSLASPGAGLLAAADKDGRIWESENNGLDWVEVPLPVGAERPLAVSMSGVPATVLLTTQPMGLYQRPIGAPIPEPAEPGGEPTLLGSLWSRARTSTSLLARPKRRVAAGPVGWTALAVPPVDATTVSPVIRTVAASAGAAAPWYAAVRGYGLWCSEDQGRSWRACTGLPADVYAIRTAGQPAEVVAVATSDGCWVSLDRGQTWEPRSGGLDETRHVRALEIHPEDPNAMLAGAAPVPGAEAARGGTRFRLFETADGGKTWTHVRKGFPLELEYDTITDIRYDPAATENAIVALESGELWRTRNGGDWWEPIARQIHVARVLCAVL